MLYTRNTVNQLYLNKNIFLKILDPFSSIHHYMNDLGSPFCLSKLIFPICHKSTKKKERKRKIETTSLPLPSRPNMTIPIAFQRPSCTSNKQWSLQKARRCLFKAWKQDESWSTRGAGVRPSLQGPLKAHLIQHPPLSPPRTGADHSTCQLVIVGGIIPMAELFFLLI